MEPWTIHHFQREAASIHPEPIVSNLSDYIRNLKQLNIPVIFSLAHLSKITHLDMDFLINSINRKREAANYKLFAVAKRSGGRRFIHAPTKRILALQAFVNKYILQKLSPHPMAFAYTRAGGIGKCAEQHLGARWLLRFDLKDFFYSICEYSVYKIFKKLGYTRLLSFELARLVTTTRLPEAKRYFLRKPLCASVYDGLTEDIQLIYSISDVGVLPQGAPSSPMLSNLVAFQLDCDLTEYAHQANMVYSRYADDIFLSCYKLPKGESIQSIRKEVVNIIANNRFKENKNKFHVSGPGARKLMLGLLIDGDRIRISKFLAKRILLKLYIINKYGLSLAAKKFNFDSSFGLYNHIQGLIAYVKEGDRKKWEQFHEQFMQIRPEWI